MAMLKAPVQEISQISAIKLRPFRIKTKGFCSNCFLDSPARIFESKGKVFLTKYCSFCKRTETVLLENDSRFFRKFYPLFPENSLPNALDAKDLKKVNAQFLYFNATGRCNLDCAFCIANSSSNPKNSKTFKSDISSAEVSRVLREGEFRNRFVFFTGGEPTVARNLPALIKTAKSFGNFVGIYTNGVKLANREYVKELAKAGLDLAVVSFDSFSEGTMKSLRGGKYSAIKQKAIGVLHEEGIKVSMTPVIANGINDSEILDFLEYSSKNRKAIRQIMLRTFLPYGRYSIRRKDDLLASDVIKLLEKKTNGKISEADFYLFQKARFSAYRAVKKFLGKDSAEKFAWGKGYSILLRVDGKGGYEPFFSGEYLERISREIDEITVGCESYPSAVLEFTKRLPAFMSKELFDVLPLLRKSFGNRNKMEVLGMEREDILELHVADINVSFNSESSRFPGAFLYMSKKERDKRGRERRPLENEIVNYWPQG